jgi:hypothetical protein
MRSHAWFGHGSEEDEYIDCESSSDSLVTHNLVTVLTEMHWVMRKMSSHVEVALKTMFWRCVVSGDL